MGAVGMAETWNDTIDEIRRRLQELVDVIEEALVPQPERVPVPVKGGRDRRRPQRRR